MRDIWSLLKRAAAKPPKVVLCRVCDEIRIEADRFFAPIMSRRLTIARLVNRLGVGSFEELWDELGKRPFPAHTKMVDGDHFEAVCPADRVKILDKAARAERHQVDILGSGHLELGEDIDWHKDYKSGFSWPPAYIRSIDYNNPERPSDVKFPWELSRLQWLMPAGQAYLLTGEERYAETVRDVLSSWIDANPYAYSVNWACTMEVALRIISWTWFFHVFHQSAAWRDCAFRAKFLTSLYLHGLFTERHLERSDINGNHYAADAAGLFFAGLFFGNGVEPAHWQKLGWQILCDELPRQVHNDGVDFEASVPYHRLVLELFFLPALFRRVHGEEVPSWYRDRLLAMAKFTAAYSRLDGTVPLWGDADDARVLPFGGQSINDHRYLLGWLGSVWDVEELTDRFFGPLREVYWLLGPEVADSLGQRNAPSKESSRSVAFPDGGFYVMRNDQDHLFIDCGPVGLAGRGGHGHNDCLSLEARLAGCNLLSDCGAYLYTASYVNRNKFRSTASHNTPQIDQEEMNRFIRPDYLWNLHYDALPEVRCFDADPEMDLFVGTHAGYQRLDQPVAPVRTVALLHRHHLLAVLDTFEGIGEHLVEIPFHLAPGVQATRGAENVLHLHVAGKSFDMVWDADGWQVEEEEGLVSPSYGVALPIRRIVFRRHGSLMPLLVCIAPETGDPVESLHLARTGVAKKIVF